MTSRTRLEMSYRRLLRAYPRSWRRVRLEEVLGVLLDDAAASERDRVGFAGRIDLVGHGVLAHLIRWADLLPSAVQRSLARLALAGGAALSAAMLVLAELYLGSPTASDQIVRGTFGPFLTVSALTYLGWLATLVSALCGSRRLYRTTAALTLLSVLATPVTAQMLHLQRAPLAILATLGCLNVAVLLLDPGTSVTWRGWVTGIAAGLGALLVRPEDGIFSRTTGDQRYGFYWMSDSNYRLASIAREVPVAVALALALALGAACLPKLRQAGFALALFTLCWAPLAFAGRHTTFLALTAAVAGWLLVTAALTAAARHSRTGKLNTRQFA
jgi:hypothetical protein